MTRLETADYRPTFNAVDPRSNSFGDSDMLPMIQESSLNDERIQEKCGISAIYSKKGQPAAAHLIEMQKELQHRGFDAAGRAVFYWDTREIEINTGMGRVENVFDGTQLSLLADRGFAQNRYATSGGDNKDSFDAAQPISSTYKGRTVVVNFNGNIPESQREILRENIPGELLKQNGYDTNDLADAYASAPGESEEERIYNAYKDVTHAYSLNLMNDEGRMFGLRGPSGTWPLWVGETEDEILFSSETRVEKMFNGKDIKWREVRPGELVEATEGGIVSTQLFEPVQESMCMLHAMYGAKGDSKMVEGLTFLDFRKEAGRELAREYPTDADIIVGVPATGRQAALGYAEAMGRELTEAIKLLSHERSYMDPSADASATIVNGKFEVITDMVKGKSAVVIEDSLIKGVTAGGDPLRGLKGTIQMLREAGATRVDFLTALPKFIEGCDMGYVVIKDKLAAVVKQEVGTYRVLSFEEIAEKIGADSFGALSIEGLDDVVERTTGRKDAMCTLCFGGPHPLERDTEQVIRQEIDTKEEVVVS